MRRAITMLGARGTVVLVLVIVVGAVLGLARMLGDRAPASRGLQPVQVERTQSTVDPTAGDDGVPDSELTNPPADPAIATTAKAFVAAWLRRDLSPQQWHKGLSTLATADLLDLLNGVDPSGVPADRTTGEPVLSIHTDGYAEVAVPVNSGTVQLKLVREKDRWLVSGVDWGRA